MVRLYKQFKQMAAECGEGEGRICHSVHDSVVQGQEVLSSPQCSVIHSTPI
jgi:hypothetical protein